jgi:hypothetical protein
MLQQMKRALDSDLNLINSIMFGLFLLLFLLFWPEGKGILDSREAFRA